MLATQSVLVFTSADLGTKVLRVIGFILPTDHIALQTALPAFPRLVAARSGRYRNDFRAGHA
jgi:hypothetical protein